jgi:8-oxo-dGTP pyrophosphatase MutT (NUDIX family)
VRALIERRLAARVGPDDPHVPLLANVVGDVSEELRAAISAPSRRAAVLVALTERDDGLHVLLTERATHLAHHPGQVSFPGGRIEPIDDGPIAAALREAWEEVGLPPKSVTVAGCLAPHATGTGFSVTPVVGFVREPFVPRPDPNEVSAVFAVPLAYVLDDANVRVEYRERFNSRFRVYEFRFDGYRIWGATASMLMSFSELLK